MTYEDRSSHQVVVMFLGIRTWLRLSWFWLHCFVNDASSQLQQNVQGRGEQSAISLQLEERLRLAYNRRPLARRRFASRSSASMVGRAVG